MEVASTLWPNIKSQKLLEHQFRLRWTKSGSRTQLRQANTDQDQHGSDKEAQDSLLDKAGAVGATSRLASLVGRPGPWAPPP